MFCCNAKHFWHSQVSSQYSLLQPQVLLTLHVLRLQWNDTTVQQNLSVQFGCQTDVVVFSAI
jgi:hypothetical protein